MLSLPIADVGRALAPDQEDEASRAEDEGPLNRPDERGSRDRAVGEGDVLVDNEGRLREHTAEEGGPRRYHKAERGVRERDDRQDEPWRRRYCCLNDARAGRGPALATRVRSSTTATTAHATVSPTTKTWAWV